MAGCMPVPIAQRIQVPAAFLRPQEEMSNESVAIDMATFLALGHDVYVASPGTHGSSMLVPERAGGETEQTWQFLLEFLHTPDPQPTSL